MFKSLKFYRFAIPFIVFILITGLLWQSLGHTSNTLPSALIGKSVPAFQLTAVNDSNQLFTQELFSKGKASLLNIWATWCSACRYEHEFLLSLAQQGVPIYGLNYRDRREAAQLWLRDFGNPYQLSLFDGDGRTAINLGVYGTPETYLIDKNGIIRYRHVGVLDQYVWEREFLPRLRKLSQ